MCKCWPLFMLGMPFHVYAFAGPVVDNLVLLAMVALLVTALVALWLLWRQRQQLIRMMGSYHIEDGVTQLPGKALLDDRLTNAVQRPQQQVANAVNELPLRKLCADWRKALRKSDTLARWGLGEFVVILEHLTRVEGALEVANNLITIAEQQRFVANGKVHIGVAVFPNHGADPVELLQSAEASIEQAAAKGKNGYAVA